MLRQKKNERSKPRSSDNRESSSKKKKSQSREDGTARYHALADSDEEDGKSKRSHHRNRKSKRESDNLKRQLCQNVTSAMPGTSSDDDIDVELREGINNVMKLRDEYDKLEGALRKLGVDPESVVGEQGEDEGAYDEDDEDDEDGNGNGSSSSHSGNRHQHHHQVDDLLLEELDPLSSLQHRTARLRRHLDILEEVDESLLSSDAGGDDSSVQPRHPSYPWVQMALPGGGIVSVPLASTSNSRQSMRGGPPHAPPPSNSSQIHDLGDPAHTASSLTGSISGLGHPGGSSIGGSSARIQSPDSAHSLPPGCGSSLGKPDLLTVNAGEPVTHFNLDQLLEIVQSFQLDTTLANNEDMASHNLHLALANPPNESSIVKNPNDPNDLGNSCDCKPCDTLSEVVDHSGGVAGDVQPRETHSCPSSPTETDCSSGFSTLRRRSVTLTEKIRTSKDGSKTQVVRQYGCNTTSAKEPQSVTYQQNAFVYINGKIEENPMGSQSFPSLLPITATSPSASAAGSVGPGHATLPRSATEAANSASAGGWTTTGTANRNAGSSSYRGHIVRLNSIEPNTVMFSTKDYPLLSDVTVPEIIDELEKQFEDKLHDLQGVRLVANNVYICLSKKESLQHLTTYGFYVRGIPIKVVDITNDSVVICLTGVPHYITDATITMLVSTFGISIGEVERRFYKGIDTGERFVRLKPRAHTQVPDFVTVGGCKILIRVLNHDEICEPYTLQSAATVNDSESTSGAHPKAGNSNSYRSSSSAPLGSISGPKSRSKPGHCNGTVNSPSSASEVPPPPPLSSTCIPFSSSCSMTSSRTEMISTGITGLLSTPVAPPQLPLTSSFRESQLNTSGADNSSNSSVPASPKIGRSLRSRIGAVISRSSPQDNGNNGGSGSTAHHHHNHQSHHEDQVDLSTNSYMAGDALDIPTLSPPPYKAPSSNGSTSSVITGASNGHPNSSSTLSRLRGSSSIGENGDAKKSSKESSGGGGITSALRNKYKLPKTSDSSNSLTSSMAGGKTSIEAVRDGSNNNNTKRTSVVFEEPGSGPGSSSRITSKTVNGILRKGSGPGDEIVTNVEPTLRSSSKSRRKDHQRKSVSKSNRTSKSGMDPLAESPPDGTVERSSRSRSNSTKTSSKNGSHKESGSNVDAKKTQKDLALTRDLPWCGCWGNGCL